MLAVAAALGGCSAVGGITGGVAGIASGAATANPAVGVAVGVGVKAAVDTSIKAVLRQWSDEEQQRIAAAIGAMTVGERRAWSVEHAIPYQNARGEITLLRTFDTPLAPCREALFTVAGKEAGTPTPPFVTTVCQGAAGWRWAVAEPAVARWGALQ
jgi:hypothetical protein